MRKISLALAALAWLAGWGAAPLAAAPPSGPDLVNRLSCLGCHTLKGQGRSRGPAWDGLGSRLTPEAIKKQIVTPRGRMPSFAQLKPEELEAVVEYLSRQK